MASVLRGWSFPLLVQGGGIVLRSPEEVAGAAGSGSSLPPALQESLDIRNTLLQTCHLRNTSWVIGVVINTGNETKFGMCNKGAVPIKVSRVDRWIDCFTASVFCGQVLLLLLLLMMVMRMIEMMMMVMTMMAMMMWRRKMMRMMMVVVVFSLATAAAALDCSRSSASLPNLSSAANE